MKIKYINMNIKKLYMLKIRNIYIKNKIYKYIYVYINI